MRTPRRRKGGALRAEGGLLAVYRPYFEGEGRSIALQSAVAFVGGLVEALMLVVVAKLAFSIGADPSTSQQGLGPLDSIKITTIGLFWLAAILALLRGLTQAWSSHLAAGLIARRMTVLRMETFHDYSVASWSMQSSMDEAAVLDLLVRYVTKMIGAIQTLAVTATSVFSLVALLLSAVAVDPLSAVLVVATGTVLFTALRPLSTLAKRYSEAQLVAGRKYFESSREAIGASLEIRAFGVNVEVSDRLAAATQAEVRPVYLGQFLARLVSAVYQLAAISMVLIGLFGVYEFLDRPLASLGAIVIILVRAMNQASTIQGAYHTAVETAPFATSLTTQRTKMLASEPKSGSVLPPARGTLSFSDVSYSYAEDDLEGQLALDGVSFDIEFGEAIGVIGPSGSGKSTLIQLLLRLREPRSGRYAIGGIDTREIDADAWFRQIAFVPQDCRALNTTIMENIRFYRMEITDDQVIEAAKRAHLHDEIMAMPDGYETEMGTRGGSLSGGQRQRMAIARALASAPQILVLDEPTSALDMRSESLVQQTLSQIQGEVTLVIIAHRLSTLKTCDRIMVYGQGKLQAFGERAELEEHNAFYRDAIALSKLRS